MNLRLEGSTVVHAEFMDGRRPLCNVRTNFLTYAFRTGHAVTCKRCRTIESGFAPRDEKAK
jgi:hypothetical protein